MHTDTNLHETFRRLAESAQLAWRVNSPHAARLALRQCTEAWNQEAPEFPLSDATVERALRLAEYTHGENVPVIETSDNWDTLAIVLQRLLSGISLLFLARLMALPLAGEPARPWLYDAGFAAYLAVTGVLLRVDLGNRRVQETVRQRNRALLLARQQKQFFEAALAHLRYALGL